MHIVLIEPALKAPKAIEKLLFILFNIIYSLKFVKNKYVKYQCIIIHYTHEFNCKLYARHVFSHIELIRVINYFILFVTLPNSFIFDFQGLAFYINTVFSKMIVDLTRNTLPHLDSSNRKMSCWVFSLRIGR